MIIEDINPAEAIAKLAVFNSIFPSIKANNTPVMDVVIRIVDFCKYEKLEL